MWKQVDKRAFAIYYFRGKEIIPDYGLDFDQGDEIKIIGENGDWYYGALTKTEDDNNSHLGIFPSSYVHLDELLSESEQVHNDVICEELVDVASTWVKIWKKLYVELQEYQFEVIGKGINEILDGRKTLINETLTKDEVYDLKHKLANKIDWGNRKLNLDLVPRDENGRIVYSRDCGLIQLYKYHSKSVEQSSSFNTLGRKRLKAQHNVLAHLHVSLEDINLTLNEELGEIYFSLYDGRKQSFISERFLFKYHKEGASSFPVNISSASCAFEDINSTDLLDLYVVCHIYRIGKMFLETKGKNGQEYRRPFGCSILSITSDTSEKEVEFKIYSGDEKEFYQIHDFLIKKQYGKVSLTGSSINVIPRLYVGDIKKIRHENSIFKNSARVNKIGFPDVFLPGLLRNDLYITILSGDFDKNMKNVEVSLLILDSTGNWQPNSVYSAVQVQNIGFIGSNNYKSAIYYKINSPKWIETIKIALPLDIFQDCHLRFEFRLCSSKKNEKKLFGFAFLKLKDKREAIISNNVHQLNILKCEDSGKLNPSHYLTIDAALGNSQYPKTKETFSIRSLLVSTKLTQNADLVNLLKFKSNPENIPAALDNIAMLKGEHLLYFLQDILDVLFSLFSDDNGNSTTNSGPVFIIIVNIIKALEDPKYESFKTTLDAYIDDLFSGALVYKGILSTVSYYAETILSKAEEMKKASLSKSIQNTFESSEYLFKFVIKSHILFSRATQGTIEDSFIGDVENLFNTFSKALTIETEIETQAKLYLNLHKIYNQLIRVMPKYDITLQVLKVYNSPLRECESSLSPSILKSLEKLVASELFSDKDCRSKILQEVCRHLKHYISHREELQLCTTVMSSILLILYNDSKTEINVHSDVEILSTTLEMLVQSILILERSSSIVGQLITCLMGLLQLMDSFHFNRVWDEYSTHKPMRDLILRMIFVFRDIIKFPEVYPEYWLQLRLLNNSIMLNALDEISKAMNVCVKYDSHLWTQYFSLVVLFLTQDPLQLETFDKKKRLQILDQFGDMRTTIICQQFYQMWSHLGPNKIDYLSMVGSFLEASLVPQDEVRNTIIPVFYDLMEAEQTSTGDFKQFEADIIDKMDIVIGNGTAGDASYIHLFKSILLKKLTACPYMWKQKGFRLIESLANLLERLLDYRENFEISRKMHCMVNLLYLYEKLQTEDIYLRYIYKLHDLHLSCENYIEAGNTLLLHSEICKNEETKENIYLSIIKYFDAGKLFEKGIPIMEELVHQYKKNYQYSKLSHVLQKMSCFYDRILTEYRPEVEFFRVGFFGQGCSSFFRNKEFVYRGLEYEKLANFIPRILEEYPNAQILGNSNPPDPIILNSEGIYLQICNVRPISNQPILKTKLNDKIKAFYLTNDVKIFQFDRRLANNIMNNLNESKESNQETASISSENEFKNMWIERTTLVISNTLPGILRHFEVIEKDLQEISPLRYACERIELVNQQLEDFNAEYTAEPMKNLNPFTMKLQGMIEAAVMGGLPKYKEAFFNDGQQSLETKRLRKLISDQLKILEKSLKIHERLVQQQAPNLEPLHMRLVECLGQMKSLENEFKVKRNSSLRRESNSPSIINSPLPPLPPLNTLKSDCTHTNSNRSSISSSGGYGLIFKEEPEEDEDQVYCHLDGDNSINEENFSSARMAFNINHNNNTNNNVANTTMSLQRNQTNNNSEYIFVPPSQLRNGNEMFPPPPPPLPTTAPPRIPPKKVNSSQALNMIESSPPILPRREPKKLNKFGGSYSGTMNTIGMTPTPPSSPIKNSNSNSNNVNIANSPPPIPPKKPISPVKRISQISEPDYSNGDNNEELNGNNITSPTSLHAISPTPSSRSSSGLLATMKTTSEENLMMGSLKRRTHKEFYVLPSKET